jgi:fructokinase
VWALEAKYLALGLVSAICILSPQRIVIGGGVMNGPGLLQLVRREIVAILNGYIQHAALGEHIDRYVSAPGLGSRAGVLGAIALAQAALSDPDASRDDLPA